MRDENTPIRALTCCCCGSETRGRQWWNRDTGYGICPDCYNRQAKKEDVKTLDSYYGKPGFHHSITHSAAPWGVENDTITSTEGDVASVHFQSSRDIEKAKCNVRLIAAAPELLAALEGLLNWGLSYTSPRDPNSPHSLLLAAQDAVKKAKGQI